MPPLDAGKMLKHLVKMREKISADGAGIACLLTIGITGLIENCK